MSYNRRTKAYQSRVKRLAKDFEYPPRTPTEDGKSRHMTYDEIIAAQPDGTPRYLIEDALSLLARESLALKRYAEKDALRYQAVADKASSKLIEIKKPKLSLVGAA
ncbi:MULTISPECIES: hypothetical protein [unclassified Rhizobium]|uniref:hypothetical protein n=1 Tax=unclassified Rhizobium TaxID=2613769 RepID=UPI0007133762|nr:MULTISPECIES: hypothetical protein [unclassified Rhizobium]KRA59010.1 hypothetical protein ASD85_15085 [Rhizobium sp. Root651]